MSELSSRCLCRGGWAAPVALFLAASIVAGCSGEDHGSSCGRFVDGVVRALTWYGGDDADRSEGGNAEELAESRALRELEDAHHSCNPASRVERVVVRDRATVMSTLEMGTDADVAIVNADQRVIRLCEGGLLRPLDDFERQPEAFASHIRDEISMVHEDPDGAAEAAPRTLCAIPLAQHQLNRLYVNTEHLPKQLDIQRWTSLDAFLSDLQQLPPTPLFATASKDTWTMSLAAFENVMVAAVGPERYQQLWKGHALRRVEALETMGSITQYSSEPDLQALEDTLVQMERLRPYLDTSSEDSEKQAWARFKAGEFSFYVMGNWREPDVVDSPNIVAMNFPGTQDHYVFTVDALVIPSQAQRPENGLGFARTVTDPTVNGHYNDVKGSHSVLAEADTAIAAEGMQYVEGLPLLLKGGFKELPARLEQWLATDDSQQLVDYVRREYCTSWGRTGCPTLHDAEAR